MAATGINKGVCQVSFRYFDVDFKKNKELKELIKHIECSDVLLECE